MPWSWTTPLFSASRDDLLAAISAAIRQSEHRFTEAISAAEARLGAKIEASAADTRLGTQIDTSAAEARLGARIEASAAEARLDTSAGRSATRGPDRGLGGRSAARYRRPRRGSGPGSPLAAEARLGARIEASAAEARLDTSAAEARLGARIEASAAETRRHMGVVAEGLRSNITLVAEGVVTLTERLGAEMREGVEIIDRRLLRVEARLLATGPPGPPHI